MLLTIEKSIAALFFLAATSVLLVLLAKGITHPAQALFAEELREDPHDLLASVVIRFVPQVSKTALVTLAAVSAGYLVLEAVEAAGLLLGQLWVEYLVLLETAAFLPYEVYEIVRRPTLFKAAILIVNVVILWYLARRRMQLRRSGGRNLIHQQEFKN